MSAKASRRRPGRKRSAAAQYAIFEATLAMLRTTGFYMTMEGVAAQAGVAKATVYRWWPTKAQLEIDTIQDIRTMITTSAAWSLGRSVTF